MRILSITAGAAGMYCGSCFRDNALAAELKARGHDVLLVPVYTPTVTDETNVSHERVFFGGISVYLQQHAAIFRRTPRLLDRLWDSPRVIRALAGRSISIDPARLGDLTVSMLRGEEGNQRKEFAKLIDWLASEAAPDVIDLPNSLLIGLARPLGRQLKRPVCCTLQGEDLFLDGLPEPHRRRALGLIRQAIPDVDRFVAVSEFYATFMSGYLSIPPEKIAIVPLGLNLEGYQMRTRSDGEPFAVGYFARIAPEKGLWLLCEAYVRFRRRSGVSCRLEVAGHLPSDQRSYLRDAERILTEAGFGDEFHYRGTLDRDRKIAFLRTLDVLSVPTTYADPKGTFVLEAMACGVPVVQPRHGAFPEILAKTSGGLLVEPRDAESLAEGLFTLWKDPDLRDQMGRGGFDGVRQHYSVGLSADRVLRIYEALTPGQPALAGRSRTSHP